MNSQKQYFASILIILVIVVVSGVLFLLKRGEITSAIKGGTPTPISDQTGDWKTFVSQAGYNDEKSKKFFVYYGYQYPPNFKVERFAGYLNYAICNSPISCMGFLGESDKPGAMYVDASLYGKGIDDFLQGLSTSPAMLGGKKALRVFWNKVPLEPAANEVAYFISDLEMNNVDKNSGFTLECVYIPDPNKDMATLCDKIASTLSFEAVTFGPDHEEPNFIQQIHP